MEQIDDFEASRRCVLNLYHSYVQTHAGYVITVGIGIAAAIFSYKSFYDIGLVQHLWLVLLAMAGVEGYMFKRILYWTQTSSIALGIPAYRVQRYWALWYARDCECRKSDGRIKQSMSWRDSSPNTSRIVHAIDYFVKFNDYRLPRLSAAGLEGFFRDMDGKTYVLGYSLIAVALFVTINYSYSWYMLLLALVSGVIAVCFLVYKWHLWGKDMVSRKNFELDLDWS